MTEALTRLQSEWDAVEAVDGDDSSAAASSVRHGLRGMDAIHLASAIFSRKRKPVMVTWDATLRRAAQAEGLAISL